MMKQILIIEDDPIFTFLLQTAIKSAELEGEIYKFSNGLLAQEYLKKEYKSTKEYIIFLDLNMPVMNGWIFLDELKNIADPQNSLVFILTSSKDKNDSENLKKNPFVTDFISKPINESIIRSLKEIIVSRFAS